MNSPLITTPKDIASQLISEYDESFIKKTIEHLQKSISKKQSLQKDEIYKLLLIKYISHVINCEGTSFIDYHVSATIFTKEEQTILEALENEPYDMPE